MSVQTTGSWVTAPTSSELFQIGLSNDRVRRAIRVQVTGLQREARLQSRDQFEGILVRDSRRPRFSRGSRSNNLPLGTLAHRVDCPRFTLADRRGSNHRECKDECLDEGTRILSDHELRQAQAEGKSSEEIVLELLKVVSEPDLQKYLPKAKKSGSPTSPSSGRLTRPW